jgi:hypothetical protein
MIMFIGLLILTKKNRKADFADQADKSGL